MTRAHLERPGSILRAGVFLVTACAGLGACSMGPGGGDAPSEELAEAAALIDETGLLATIETLAHDSMRGRATPSPELEATATWIARRFETLGLEGPFGGAYLQWYETQGVRAPNVAGLVRGSDAALADEYIVFSAHMDHVGVGRPDASGDSIYNGADDDASGTAVVLEIAEAFRALERTTRRSTLFLLVSGEEQGLWGSRHFAENPPVPIDAVVANLNADMLGRNWTDRVVAIGKEQSDLGETLDVVAAAHPELRMRPIEDPWPEENFYRRSDHFNFARQGVPVLFFFNGTHDDYHRPSDEVELIDAEKAARIARLMFYLGVEVAERDARPEWDPESYEQVVNGGGNRRE